MDMLRISRTWHSGSNSRALRFSFTSARNKVRPRSQQQQLASSEVDTIGFFISG